MQEQSAPGAALARLLTTQGVVVDPQWHRAILTTDRQAFLPEVIYGSDPAHPGWECPITQADPRWERWTSGDYALVTQVDDGDPVGEQGRGRVPTSSVSQPSLVVAMLQALDARDGHRVLEIGTGSGYNTALLCQVLGDEAVVSVEIDSGLAKIAVDNLAEAGHHPTVLDRDGVGDPVIGVGMGTFDRVLSTVAAREEIPRAWVNQTRPGGVVVTPYQVGNTDGVLVRLEVGEDGVGTGRVMGDAPFMLLRSQRPGGRGFHDVVDETAPGVVDGHTDVNPRLVPHRDRGWQLALGALVPGLRYASFEADASRPEWAGEATIYVYDQTGSWALGEYTPSGAPYEARRYGTRDLWGEVGRAWQVWQDADRPGLSRLGVTVDDQGTHLWVDSPNTRLDGVGLG
ncbi:hypothetical protein HUT17_05155 (plasmid) [Nocardiopsis flavescens]|nr:hypothetical protein HUT17_05155 [Nocardiopsis flavescens]